MSALNNFLLLCALTCLGQKGLGSEIINGKKAGKNSLLYMASVQSLGRHICGGFLINKEFVLTAAHCDTYSMSVVLGTHNLKEVKDKTMRYQVQKCKHPSFVDVASGNDIMLLKLSRKAELDETMKTIPLPTQNAVIKANTKCLVAGWGISEPNGKAAVNELREVNVSTIDLNVCKDQWKQPSVGFNIPAGVICAGGYETNKGFCQGDSGGPLVCDGKAVGIVSFNYIRDCRYPNLPNVYTEISKFLPWIEKILREKTC